MTEEVDLALSANQRAFSRALFIAALARLLFPLSTVCVALMFLMSVAGDYLLGLEGLAGYSSHYLHLDVALRGIVFLYYLLQPFSIPVAFCC